MPDETPLHIFTDGACRGNPGPGGWAALLRYGAYEKTLTGAEGHTTNNRMELLAVIAALQHLKKTCVIHLTTDSQYVRQGITQWLPQWKKRDWKTKSGQAVKNQDLWERLEKLAAPHTIHWHWVKAHNGHSENERVDQLARRAIVELTDGKRTL